MLYTDMVDIVWLQMPFGSPSHAIAVPPVADLAGFELYAQAFGYAPNVNDLGVVTSNGIYGRVGR